MHLQHCAATTHRTTPAQSRRTTTPTTPTTATVASDEDADEDEGADEGGGDSLPPVPLLPSPFAAVPSPPPPPPPPRVLVLVAGVPPTGTAVGRPPDGCAPADAEAAVPAPMVVGGPAVPPDCWVVNGTALGMGAVVGDGEGVVVGNARAWHSKFSAAVAPVGRTCQIMHGPTEVVVISVTPIWTPLHLGSALHNAKHSSFDRTF